jgi:transposase-like protein
MAEFMDLFGSEEQCEAALVAARWANGFMCPACNASPNSSFFRRDGRLYWQCSACRYQCSLLSGTVFESTKLPLRRWFLAMHLMTQAKNNISALELMRHLGVCYKTAWLLKHKLMEVMRQRELWRQLDGLVQIDDAVLGGELTGGKPGRAGANKVPFVAAVSTSVDGQPRFVCLSQQPLNGEQLAGFAASSLSPHAHVVSDGLNCFRHIVWVGAKHQAIVTGGGKESVKIKEFIAINTVLGNLKTAIAGTYHAFGFAKYARRYLAEFQYRFNRRFNLRTILPRLLRAASVTLPCPATFIRTAEVGR